MRNLLATTAALSLLLAGGAAFAQSGQGGSLGSSPAAVPMGTPSQGTGGPGNAAPTYPGIAYPGTTSSGGAGVAAPGGQGSAADPNLSKEQGNPAYGVQGKVGGDRR
jgi:hypothetical protein